MAFPKQEALFDNMTVSRVLDFSCTIINIELVGGLYSAVEKTHNTHGYATCSNARNNCCLQNIGLVGGLYSAVEKSNYSMFMDMPHVQTK